MSLNYKKFLEVIHEFVVEPADFAKWVSYSTYQGFNAEKVFAQMAKKEDNLNQLRKDVVNLLIYFVVGGANTERKSDKWTDGGREYYTDLFNKYDIKKNLEGEKNGDDGKIVLTLSRISLAFPDVTCALYCTGIGKPLVGINGLPDHFSFPGAASFMTETEYDRYAEFYLEFMVQFALITQRNKKTQKSEKDIRTIQKNFIDLSRSNAIRGAELVNRRTNAAILVQALATLAKKSGISYTEKNRESLIIPKEKA